MFRIKNESPLVGISRPLLVATIVAAFTFISQPSLKLVSRLWGMGATKDTLESHQASLARLLDGVNSADLLEYCV